ncbi:MAG: FAD-dependent oxidoreductase [Bacteroidetes bacterium]|nr:FAD-dependent oxidoreductase [Bacteroidota bacterium]MCL5026804.1 FAD-dependent oxidoreductase [Chloroflexota bacterium]
MALHVWPKSDVLVAGGGPAGIIAAIAAARNGAKTLLVERYAFLGGEAATGLNIHGFHSNSEQHIVRGIPWEMIERLKQMGGAAELRFPDYQKQRMAISPSKRDIAIDREAFQYLALQMLEEAGVQVLLHAFVSDVVMEGDTLTGLVVETKSGRVMLPADRVVDATGDGDVAARAGVPFEKGRRPDEVMQPMTLMFTMGGVDLDRAVDTVGIRRALAIDPLPWQSKYMHFTLLLEQWTEELRAAFPELMGGRLIGAFTGNSFRKGIINGSTTTHIGRVDGTDAEQLSRAEVEGRKLAFRLAQFMRQHVPGFEDSYLLSTAPHIGVRETRRIIGEYQLTYEDVIETHQQEDVVALGGFWVDIHHYERGSESYVPSKGVTIKDNGAYDIPYRCLVPKGVENLLMAGRCISAAHEAQASARVMGICMGIGQAAGTALALSLRAGVSPRRMDVRLLQDTLLQQGTFLGSRFAAGEAKPPVPST